jgi:hypothetical protein
MQGRESLSVVGHALWYLLQGVYYAIPRWQQSFEEVEMATVGLCTLQYHSGLFMDPLNLQHHSGVLADI